MEVRHVDDFASEDERALYTEALSALPMLREQLALVWDEPLGHFELAIDQDTWPARDAAILELCIEPAPEHAALKFLFAPYVEGRTWPAEFGFQERPAGDFYARTKPRVDARCVRASGERVFTAHLDGSELGEEPLVLSVKLEDEGITEPLRGAAALPSLRQLVASGAGVTLRRHSRAGASSTLERDDSSLELRLVAKVPAAGGKRVTLWQSRRDAFERTLAEAPAFAECHSELERQVLLSAVRERPLRAALRARSRRDRIAAALEEGRAPADADRFAAARMLATRGDALAVRRQSLRAADAFSRAASLLLERFEPAAATYAEFFELWRYLTRALGVLAKAGHDAAFTHCGATAARVSREMAQAHPDEPDYRRALAHALVLRAEAVDARSGGLDDAALEEAVELLEALARRNPWPWCPGEALRMRARAEALYQRHHALRSDPLSSLPPRPR